MIRRLAFLLALTCAGLAAQTGTVERHTVRGRSLEGNLSEDSPDRLVAVYLPPAYAAEPDKRFPVVYLLHGFTDSVDKWWFNPEHWINLPQTLDRAVVREDVEDVIVVMPDALTRFYGSFYSRSVTTGDWETFLAEELVAYIDSHYRTLPQAASRGLAGHSMGGYGAMRIGMKRPDVFSSVYLLSPCCLAPMNSRPRQGDGPPPWETIETNEQVDSAEFFTKIVLAFSAAWAPNPTKPPFYVDLPTVDGEPQPDVAARFTANAPLAQVDGYIDNLVKLKALAFDAGDEDRGIAAAIQQLDAVLERYGIERDFEIYKGDHLNRIAERIETQTMPFFTRHLAFE